MWRAAPLLCTLLLAVPGAAGSPVVPRLPERAERIVTYAIHVELDPARHTLAGRETVTWRNRSDGPVPELWFHLYLNAFKHSRTTFMRERLREGRDLPRTGEWGRIDVRKLTLGGRDLTAALAFARPDDGNPDDETVARLPLPEAVPPGGEVTVTVEFDAVLPRALDRVGHAGPDFHLVAQWFPKLGVYEPAARRWNCHQFHARSEFYADYGRYDVWITVPLDVTVAATGWTGRPTRLTGDRLAYHYEQEDVHDFAFVAARGLRDLRRTYVAESHRDPAAEARLRRLGVPEEDLRLTDVEVRLLLPPAHERLADRFFAAAFQALTDMGYAYGRYPYGTLVVVDPPPDAEGAAGMEYPTFFASWTSWLAPGPDEGPESTTIHEFGHQHFYGLLGSNEFEEPWLDEGFTSYAAVTVLARHYGESPSLTMVDGLPFFGRPIAAERRTLPLYGLWRDGAFATFARRLGLPFALRELGDYRRHGRDDPMRRFAWDFLGGSSYYVNAYTKPMLLLLTLEGILGADEMARVMRAYAARFRFRHPTSADFRAVLAETGNAAAVELWDQALGGRDVLDYAVTSLSNRKPELRGFAAPPAPDLWESEVVVRRLGGLRAPVEIEVRFEGGSVRTEQWDGREAWHRLRYARRERVIAARVDPHRRLWLEADRSNDARTAGPDHRTAATLGARVLLWLQHVLAFAGGAA